MTRKPRAPFRARPPGPLNALTRASCLPAVFVVEILRGAGEARRAAPPCLLVRPRKVI
jgi:hypothetical protein